MNIDCLVDAKREYLGHFVSKAAPAFQEVLREMAAHARLLAAHEAKNGRPTPVAAVLGRLLAEVPRWDADLIQQVVVSKLRGHFPAYMQLHKKVYYANGIILNTVHSSDRKSTPSLELPTEETVARDLWRAVAAEFAEDPAILLSNPRAAAQVLRSCIQETVLRNIPVDQIVNSESESEPEPEPEEEATAAQAPVEEAGEGSEEEAGEGPEEEAGEESEEDEPEEKDEETEPVEEAKAGEEDVKKVVIERDEW